MYMFFFFRDKPSSKASSCCNPCNSSITNCYFWPNKACILRSIHDSAELFSEGCSLTCYSVLHIMVHTDEKLYTCEVCLKGVRNSSVLLRHHVIHTGEKPYKCMVCSKGFTQAVTLKDHRMIHTGEKPCTWKVWSKRFTQANHLKSHQRIHIDEKPYTCKVCSKPFTTA